MSVPRWTGLDRRHQRRMIARSAAEVVLVWMLVFGIYFVVPFTDRTSATSVVRFAIGIAGFVAVLAWQLQRVKQAALPGLRAAQALGVAIPIFLVVFAVLYLSLSQTSPDYFSEPLNHTGALYLVVTVFATVGFGDITPERDLSRILVSIQMLLDLVVIGAVVRLLTNAARSGISE